ncbi:hypothetical protein BST61_g680 [Cercospora zeina]
MAPSSPNNPALPGIAVVLRAIHHDPVETRETSEAQNEFFRSFMKDMHLGLNQDELKQATKRLRSEVRSHYNNNAIRPNRTIRGTSKSPNVHWVPAPFSRLFYSGLKIFPPEHLERLGIDGQTDDDDEEAGEDESDGDGGGQDDEVDDVDGGDEDDEEEAADASTEDHGQLNPNEQSPKHGSTIKVATSKKV